MDAEQIINNDSSENKKKSKQKIIICPGASALFAKIRIIEYKVRMMKRETEIWYFLLFAEKILLFDYRKYSASFPEQYLFSQAKNKRKTDSCCHQEIFLYCILNIEELNSIKCIWSILITSSLAPFSFLHLLLQIRLTFLLIVSPTCNVLHYCVVTLRMESWHTLNITYNRTISLFILCA